MFEDTIAAISTALGEGSIAVIRVSGNDAIKIADKVFQGKTSLAYVLSHTVHYGWIVDPDSRHRVDEVLVTVMKAPRSFTMEDVVEISCHGGIVSVRRILDLLLSHGARMAEPGEFTKRAFLNGRIDLAQSEAVMDLIRSKSDRAFHIALKQSEGSLSKQIRELRQQLIELMAHIEVNIDYPEHDVEEMTYAYIQDHTVAAITRIDQLLKSAEQGKMIREGIVTAIIGRPNVGKSSLLNELAQENRAIVTDIPGTTRDVIEETVTVGGIPLLLMDTAGIRESLDIVEQIGVEKSRSAMAEADLIFMVINQSEPLQEDEKQLLQQLQDRPLIVILNKSDLPAKVTASDLGIAVPQDRIISTSMTRHEGIEQLAQAIASIFFNGEIEGGDLTYVSNARHISLLRQAKASLKEALQGTELTTPIDMIQIDIRNAWEYLGEIVGDTASESLLDQIFSQFCLGK